MFTDLMFRTDNTYEDEVKEIHKVIARWNWSEK